MTVSNVLKASSDAMTSAGFPTKNYAGLAYLQLNAAPNDRVAYVYFNQPFPLGVTIVRATLRLYQRGAATGGTRTLTVRRAATAWIESKIVSDGRPAAAPGASATRPLGNSSLDGREWTFDVKAAMQEVSDGAPWYGFRIDSNIATAISLYSRESAGDYVPVLEVEWADAPSAPARLSPAGDRSVSVARPTLRFDFTDVTGGLIGGFEVRVSTSPTMSPVAFTSGEADAVDGLPQWTLNADLTNGTTYYWDVRVRDVEDVWSARSAVASFKRTAKPALAITAPAASPDNILYSATPTFSWTVTGQTAFQLFLLDPDNSSKVLWTSEKITSAVTSYTMPAEAATVLSPGQSYRLLVRVWDGVPREGIPEEPVAIEADRVFSFGTTSSIAGVLSLVASADPALPFVTLTWARATVPDQFVITIDGKTVAVIEAEDAAVTGTSYSYQVRGAQPGVQQTFGVAATEGTSTSPVATDTETPAGVGLWLYSLTPGGPVVALETSEGSQARPVSEEASEATAIFEPAGSTRPVMISQVVRGYVGDIEGSVRGDDLAAWEELTGPRAKTIGLTVMDRTRQIQVYNVVTGYADTTLGRRRIPVRCDYIGVG